MIEFARTSFLVPTLQSCFLHLFLFGAAFGITWGTLLHRFLFDIFPASGCCEDFPLWDAISILPLTGLGALIAFGLAERYSWVKLCLYRE